MVSRSSLGVQCGKRSPGSRPTIRRTRPAASTPPSERSAVTCAVLQDGHMLAQAHHLVEAMGDVENCSALAAQTFEQKLERLRLMGGERRSRLVEDEHARRCGTAPWRSRPSGDGRAAGRRPAWPDARRARPRCRHGPRAWRAPCSRSGRSGAGRRRGRYSRRSRARW